MLRLNTEMQKSLDARRRFPRIFLMGTEEKNSIPGVLLMMPDRTHLPVLSMSLSGLIISPTGYLSSLRIGQVLDCRLKIMNVVDPVVVQLKVVRLFSKEAYLMIESISAENRIALEQTVKDRLIFSFLQKRDPSTLHPQFHGASVWLHSLFDTNFLFWKTQNGALEKISRVLIEYDGLCFFMDGESWWLQKSIPAVEEPKGYAGAWIQVDSQKVSMGASWKERLIRLMSEALVVHPELQVFIDILRKV